MTLCPLCAFPVRRFASCLVAALLVVGLAPSCPAAGKRRQPPAVPAVGESSHSFDDIAATIARGRNLAARLEAEANRQRLTVARRELEAIEKRLAGFREASDAPGTIRDALFLQAELAVRRIAFCNPLLDFHKLLFVKRHDAGGVFHMCDQFYGFNARPGGGLCVLDDPFGPAPRTTNLLA